MTQIAKTFMLAGLAMFIAFSLISFPDQAFEASIRGLNIWWEIVFPSLLPFFITAELLIAFGVVKFIGVLFEPIMRPLFRVPGAGSFGWIMGMASGYPTGAKIAVRLREEGQLTRLEAERLVAFTNASSPLFIFGAVSVGFFHDAKLGVLLATCHYVGNALVGICMRFYGGKEKTPPKKVKQKKSALTAFREMHRTRLRDQRKLGEILSDAVVNSIKTLVMVGGFIILFSVFTKLLFLVGVSPFAATLFNHVFAFLELPLDLTLPFLSGLFEITLGAQMISQITTDTILTKALVVSFILGFNGFSIQAQVASIIAKTDIRFLPYFFARILHGIFASILTLLLYKPLYFNRHVFEFQDTPVMGEPSDATFTGTLVFLEQFGPMITISFIGITAILLYFRMPRAN